MWKPVFAAARRVSALQNWRMLATSASSSSASSVLDSILLRSLKEHYLEESKMTPPPKVSPPIPFKVVKGAIDSAGPVLQGSHGEEEITISVMRMANIFPGGGDDDDLEGISQLFLHVDISKPGRENHLHFLCGLYPDAIGIHSVSFLPKRDDSSRSLRIPPRYQGPEFLHIM